MEVVRPVKAVIMAGGEGSRLRPLTCETPKPLVPVCNRPVMGYILDLLADQGVQEVFVTLGYRPGAIPSAFGDRHRGMRIHYVTEERPLGTAGGVAALRSALDGTFLVVSGDALTDGNLRALVRFHREAGALATLGTTRVENPLEYGVVMADRTGRIRRFLEKPGWGEVFSDTVNTGIYVLEPKALKGVPPGRMYDFSRNLFPALLQMGAPLYAQVLDGYWCDIGDPAAYLQANLDLLEGRLHFTPPGAEAAPGVWAEGEVPPGITVDGPALIGRDCRLVPGTRLEAGAVLGPGTTAGPGALIRRSVTWSGVQAGQNTTLMGAVVCDGAVLGDGAGVFDGAVVGARSRLGDRAVVAPGVRLWPGTEVRSGARVDVTLPQPGVWPERLLVGGGLAGQPGSDLLPERTLRAGAAFASVLGRRGPVAIGSDGGPTAALLKQALLCGVLAAGRSVLDVGTTASPVTAFTVPQQGCAGGIHVRSHGQEARITFYDEAGSPAPGALQRSLERAVSRQDFHRAPPGVAGTVERFARAESLYLEHLAGLVDTRAAQGTALTVELDGPVWPVLHRWLERLPCRVVETGGSLRLGLDPLTATWRLGDAGPEAMLALEVWLHLQHAADAPAAVPVPVTAPRGLEVLLRAAGRTPVRVRRADWTPGDPLLSIGRLVTLAARERLTGADILSRLPPAYVASATVPCPWEAKGRVMRWLMEEHAGDLVDLVEGIRIEEERGWVLLLPDSDEPVYRVYAEGESPRAAEELAARHAARVRRLLDRPPTHP